MNKLHLSNPNGDPPPPGASTARHESRPAPTGSAIRLHSHLAPHIPNMQIAGAIGVVVVLALASVARAEFLDHNHLINHDGFGIDAVIMFFRVFGLSG
jgi:hypothetical protein